MPNTKWIIEGRQRGKSWMERMYMGDSPMPLTKDKSTPENREYWAFVEKTAAEVRAWPDWKTGRRTMPNEIDVAGLRQMTNTALAQTANPTIALKGSTVAALLDEIERLRKWNQEMVEKVAEGRLDGYRELGQRAAAAEAERDSARARVREIEKILDDHTDYEGPMPGTGDYVGGVDPGALDLIVDLLRPKR